jgi:hypothetical protein
MCSGSGGEDGEVQGEHEVVVGIMNESVTFKYSEYIR